MSEPQKYEIPKSMIIRRESSKLNRRNAATYYMQEYIEGRKRKQFDDSKIEKNDQELVIPMFKKTPRERTFKDFVGIANFLEKTFLMKKLVNEQISDHNLYRLIFSLAQTCEYLFIKEKMILFREGDEGDKFYIIIKGSMNILKSKIKEIKLSGEDYIKLLLNLKKEGENELFKKTIESNQKVFPIEKKYYKELNKLMFEMKYRNTLMHNNPSIWEIGCLFKTFGINPITFGLNPKDFSLKKETEIIENNLLKKENIKKKRNIVGEKLNIFLTKKSIKKLLEKDQDNEIMRRYQNFVLEEMEKKMSHEQTNSMEFPKNLDSIKEVGNEDNIEVSEKNNDSVSSNDKSETYVEIKKEKQSIDLDIQNIKRQSLLRINDDIGDIDKYTYLLSPEMKNVKIFYNYVFLQLDAGSSFGDTALDTKTNKRNATIQANSDCELAVIYAEDYRKYMSHEKEKLIIAENNFLLEKFFLRGFKLDVFLKDYFHYFIFTERLKGEIIFNENSNLDYIYFIKTGQIELTISTDFHSLIQIIKTISIKSKIKYDDFTIDISTNLLILDLKDKVANELSIIKTYRIFICEPNQVLRLEDYFFKFNSIFKAVIHSSSSNYYKLEIEKLHKIEERDKNTKYNISKLANMRIKFFLSRLIEIRDNELSKMTKHLAINNRNKLLMNTEGIEEIFSQSIIDGDKNLNIFKKISFISEKLYMFNPLLVTKKNPRIHLIDNKNDIKNDSNECGTRMSCLFLTSQQSQNPDELILKKVNKSKNLVKFKPFIPSTTEKTNTNTLEEEFLDTSFKIQRLKSKQTNNIKEKKPNSNLRLETPLKERKINTAKIKSVGPRLVLQKLLFQPTESATKNNKYNTFRPTSMNLLNRDQNLKNISNFNNCLGFISTRNKTRPKLINLELLEEISPSLNTNDKLVGNASLKAFPAFPSKTITNQNYTKMKNKNRNKQKIKAQRIHSTSTGKVKN